MKEKKYIIQVGIALIACLFLVGCGQTPLYSNLMEKEANEIMAILLSRGIGCTKSSGIDENWVVSVDSGKIAEAVDTLDSFGFPKDRFQTVGEVFKKTGLVSSPTEERIRFMYALSQGVAEMISQIDGVLTARVNIVLQDNNPLKEKMYPSSAAVFVKYRRGSGVDSLGPQIKKLVTNSIEGLAYEKVSLAFFTSDPNEIVGYTPVMSDQDIPRESVMGSLRMVIIVILLVIMGLILIGGGVYWYLQSRRPEEKKVTAEESE